MCDLELVKSCLKPILGDDSSDDIAEYILTINQNDDFKEFMAGIVDRNNPEHVSACELLRDVLFGEETTNQVDQKGPEIATIAAVKSKPKPTSSKSKPEPDRRNKNKSCNKNSTNSSFPGLNSSKSKTGESFPKASVSATEIKSLPQQVDSKKQKKKLKFVDFYSQDHKPGLKKGRQPCDCEAKEHNLINNCTGCGRIVCEQEGSGPCFFCGNMVCSNEEMELLTEKSKESDKLYNFLIERSQSKEWKRAVEARDKLLEVDHNEGKTKIYDDQSDYFSTNNWITDEDRKKQEVARRDFFHKNHSSREMKLILDMATRKATIATDQAIENKDELMKSVNAYLDCPERKVLELLFTDCGPPKGFEDDEIAVKTEEKPKLRTINEEIRKNMDSGMCLSMHQPYASLLVAGIKKHEGRTWNTPHRGRLWIAAASKIPDDQDILACEEMYRAIYNDNELKFPRTYPQKCLLGCVNVDDCLEQSEYRKKYPDGESDSPYVMICSCPVILPVFYPMSGQHKIFSLPADVHRKAKAALLAATWV